MTPILAISSAHPVLATNVSPPLNSDSLFEALFKEIAERHVVEIAVQRLRDLVEGNAPNLSLDIMPFMRLVCYKAILSCALNALIIRKKSSRSA
jgi:hypothetical protein